MIIDLERVTVHGGRHPHDRADLFGPMPGVRLGDVLAYEMQAPDHFEPWPGRTRVQRTYVLLDIGISLCVPCWRRARLPNGTLVEIPTADEQTWYVDLITIEQSDPGTFLLRDLFIDVMVPSDARPSRMLDLDEFADALGAGRISTSEAVDGLHRWQAFLDRHLHRDRFPRSGWTDFPPTVIQPLIDLPGTFGHAPVWPD